ncbi:hypothetical protein IPM62_01930 [Candidatus Woesebacteria bacterium]|nr:MAG: hypothetical protein IPM62_01930 [Candidatus Woesebacteria bacterium]
MAQETIEPDVWTPVVKTAQQIGEAIKDTLEIKPHIGTGKAGKRSEKVPAPEVKLPGQKQ